MYFLSPKESEPKEHVHENPIKTNTAIKSLPINPEFVQMMHE
jgi:hypothetical protein